MEIYNEPACVVINTLIDSLLERELTVAVGSRQRKACGTSNAVV